MQGLSLQEGVAGRLPGGEELAEGGGQHQGAAFEDVPYSACCLGVVLGCYLYFY
jgi:hypothetical protein